MCARCALLFPLSAVFLLREVHMFVFSPFDWRHRWCSPTCLSRFVCLCVPAFASLALSHIIPDWVAAINIVHLCARFHKIHTTVTRTILLQRPVLVRFGSNVISKNDPKYFCFFSLCIEHRANPLINVTTSFLFDTDYLIFQLAPFFFACSRMLTFNYQLTCFILSEELTWMRAWANNSRFIWILSHWKSAYSINMLDFIFREPNISNPIRIGQAK